jgi:signal peptidase II
VTRRPLVLLYATALVVIVADQLSKAWVLQLLGNREGSYRPVLDDLLWLRMVHNSGAAFGMLSNASLLFALAAAGVAVGILVYSRRLANANWLVRMGLGLELGGAVGNLIDRIRFGYVVDFIDVRIEPRLWPFVFNVADAAITVGVVLLLFTVFRPEPPANPSPASGEARSGERPA